MIDKSCSHVRHYRFLCSIDQPACFIIQSIRNGESQCQNTFDERWRVPSMLGNNFLCASTNTCIPFHKHCQGDNRCPNRTDDDQWCSRLVITPTCDEVDPSVCFDVRCMIGGRCDLTPACLVDEDEYVCDYQWFWTQSSTTYRTNKQVNARKTMQLVDMPLLPNDSNITSSSKSKVLLPYKYPNSQPTPYSCNRGIGILSNDDSVVCFCPPQYYRRYCQYHAGRLLVFLHLKSIYTPQTHRTIVIELLLLFLFQDDQVLMTHEFHVRPVIEFSRVSIGEIDMKVEQTLFIPSIFHSNRSL